MCNLLTSKAVSAFSKMVTPSSFLPSFLSVPWGYSGHHFLRTLSGIHWAAWAASLVSQCLFHEATSNILLECATSLTQALKWMEKAMKSYDQPRQHIKKQRRYFANKGPSSQSYGFSSSHVWMWELDYKESWALKNWCFWTVVVKKTLESPLDCKEIKPVNSKGN